jgi:glycogen(starch) synthase
MRILFWSELFWPYVGGAEVLASKLLPALRNRGYEFIVVTSQDYLDLPDEGQHEGIPIYRFPFRKALAGGAIDKLIETRQRVVELKQTFKPDLIHIMGVNPSVLLHLQTAGAHRAPVLVRINQEILPMEGAGPETLMGRVLRAADWVTSVSATILEDMHRWLPETMLRSSVIYSGLGIQSHAEPLPSGPPRLLCLGRLIPAKGFDLALAALSVVVDRFPNVRLVVAGDGSARPQLERKVVELGLGKVVEFLGWVNPDAVPTLLSTATMVLMPSRREGLPLVGVQAALMGRAIVATRVGGLPEVVVHERTGLLIEKEDSVALAEAITLLLSHPETAIQMGQAASRRAREMFSWERCVDAYDALYRKLGRDGTRVSAWQFPTT